MLLLSFVTTLLIVGSFQKIECRRLVNTNGDNQVSTGIRFKRDADDSKEKDAADAEKHRTEMIEKYRKEAADRAQAILARAKAGLDQSASKPEDGSKAEPKSQGEMEMLDSEIQALEDQIKAQKLEDEEEKQVKKSKSKKVVIQEERGGGGCSTLLGRLGCILG